MPLPSWLYEAEPPLKITLGRARPTNAEAATAVPPPVRGEREASLPRERRVAETQPPLSARYGAKRRRTTVKKARR